MKITVNVIIAATAFFSSMQSMKAALVVAFSESDTGKVRVQMRGSIDNYNGLLSNSPTPGFTTTYSAIMASNLFIAGYNTAPNHTYSVVPLSQTQYFPLVADFFLSEEYNVAEVPFFGFSQHSMYVDSNYTLGDYIDIDVINDATWDTRIGRPTPSQGDSATLYWDGGQQSMTFQIGALESVPEPSLSILLVGPMLLSLGIRKRS